ncbi:hypothetical protein ACFL2A_05015, partial [Thermodesulfobacteriota bacterium]
MLKWIIRSTGRWFESSIVSLFKRIQNSQRKHKKTSAVDSKLLKLGKVSNEYSPQQKEDIYLDTPFRLKHMYLLG